VYRTEMRIRQYKNCCIPQICYASATTRRVNNKNHANSWSDCHSRVEVSRQQAQKRICWDLVHALLELAVWLQAGEDRAIAAGSRADKKKRLSSPQTGFAPIVALACINSFYESSLLTACCSLCAVVLDRALRGIQSPGGERTEISLP
jgi:hypothetical protein